MCGSTSALINILGAQEKIEITRNHFISYNRPRRWVTQLISHGSFSASPLTPFFSITMEKPMIYLFINKNFREFGVIFFIHQSEPLFNSFNFRLQNSLNLAFPDPISIDYHLFRKMFFPIECEVGLTTVMNYLG